MLPPRPAEAGQRASGDIVPARDRDLPDRMGHIGHRDLHETLGQRFGRDRLPGLSGNLGGQRGKALRDHGMVDRLVASGPEDLRKLRRHQLAQ